MKTTGNQLSRWGRRPWLYFALGGILAAGATGCGAPKQTPVVFYLEGAGWFGTSGSVRDGLVKAGYSGEFSVHSWGSMLGPAHDHLIVARSKGVARGLARKIEALRKADADGPIHLIGLSAGTAVIISALEQLPKNVMVDNVVLFSSSVSDRHDLTKAMRHVRRNLYATCSDRDGILGTLPVNADGQSGQPAGRRGFRLPRKPGAETRTAYERVVNIPWKPAYLGFGWAGGHTQVTTSRFVAGVVGPRILTTESYPLDRSVVESAMMMVDLGSP